MLESQILFLPLGQELMGVIQADRLTLLLIRVFAITECLIVEASALLKTVFKRRALGFAGVESILVRQSYRTSVLSLKHEFNCVKLAFC